MLKGRDQPMSSVSQENRNQSLHLNSIGTVAERI